MFSHYWSFRMYDYPVSCGLYVRKYSWAFSFSYTDLICKHIYYPPPPPPNPPTTGDPSFSPQSVLGSEHWQPDISHTRTGGTRRRAQRFLILTYHVSGTISDNKLWHLFTPFYLSSAFRIWIQNLPGPHETPSWPSVFFSPTSALRPCKSTWL